jgi:hypothetical protein
MARGGCRRSPGLVPADNPGIGRHEQSAHAFWAGELNQSGAGGDGRAAIARAKHTFPEGLRRGRSSFASPPRDGPREWAFFGQPEPIGSACQRYWRRLAKAHQLPLELLRQGKGKVGVPRPCGHTGRIRPSGIDRRNPSVLPPGCTRSRLTPPNTRERSESPVHRKTEVSNVFPMFSVSDAQKDWRRSGCRLHRSFSNRKKPPRER